MPSEYRVDEATGILHIRRWGELTVAVDDEARQRRRIDPGIPAQAPVLLDCREVSPPDTVEGVKHLAHQASVLSKELDCGPIAIIVSGAAQYGMARMYMALTDASQPDTSVFRDYDEGLEWLKSRMQAGSGPTD